MGMNDSYDDDNEDTPSGLRYLQHFFLHTKASTVNFKTGKKLHRPFLYIERVLSMYTLNV